jgi:chromosome segregation ATPase
VNTEGFFVRIDAEVARLARSAAEERQMPLREVVERALRLFLAEITEPERRAAALHAMEEALLGRLDRRLGQHFERVAGLYAREAFDLAQALDLIKRVLAYEVKDRETFGKYLEESRAEATRVPKQRVVPTTVEAAEALETAKKAQAELNQLKAQYQLLWKQHEAVKESLVATQNERRDLEQKNHSLTNDYRREAAKVERTHARFTWAIQQFEAQRGFSKRPIADFLAQWDKDHGGV